MPQGQCFSNSEVFMLFQWYLFVFLSILYVVAGVSNQTYRIYAAGEYERRCRWFTAFVVIAVLTYVAAVRPRDFIDTRSYYNHYLRESGTWNTVVNYARSNGKDKGFYILTAILKGILGDHVQVYLGIISGISLLLVFAVYRKHSCNFLISTFLFIASGEYVQWTHNGIRQFLAVAIVFASTDLLLKKRYVLYTLIVLFASSFHASALIALPMLFVVRGKPWNMRAILMMLGILALCSSSTLLNDLLSSVVENSQYANDMDALMATGGTNAFRVLVFAIPPLLALMFRGPITRLDLPRINLSVNMSIVSLGIYIISMFTSGIYIGRVPIYFSLHNYLLLPWIIDRFFEKNSAKLIYLLLMICYMGFYYYQMHIVWGAVTSL